jgi:hypothetical protein
LLSIDSLPNTKTVTGGPTVPRQPGIEAGPARGRVMQKRPAGNGDSVVEVLTIEKKPGYVIICPKNLDYLPDQLPLFLSQTLEKWVLEHPQFRVRCVVPFTQQAMTVALHVWYDL